MSEQDNEDETFSCGERGRGPQQEQPPKPPRWASLADRLNPNRPGYDPVLKASWKTTLSKEERKKIIDDDRKAIRALKDRGKTALPFEQNHDLDADDHCETSSVAYSHIVPILDLLAQKLNKSREELNIYDPYYCAGATVQHLQGLGFDSVYNKPEDFYEMIRTQQIPKDHDVVVTNPPYSGDHFDRLIAFLKENGKPFLLLLPDHFEQRPAYKDWVEDAASSPSLLFLTSPQRYHYWTPEGRRPKVEGDQEKNTKQSSKKRKHSNLHLGTRNSPFNSLWFFSLEPVLKRKKVLKAFLRGNNEDDNDSNTLRLVPGCLLHKEFVAAKKSEQSFRGGDDPSSNPPATSSSSLEGKKAKRRRKKATGETKK
jgi:hypothetical protein